MFDVARFLALAWALVLAVRARAALELAALLGTAYLFALAIASGFTIRSEGPQEPIVAMLLALIGPTAMPRGQLPSFVPLGLLAVRWPAAMNAVTAVILLLLARRLSARTERLPQFSGESTRLSRLSVALFLIAVFEGVSAGTRVIPLLLDH